MRSVRRIDDSSVAAAFQSSFMFPSHPTTSLILAAAYLLTGRNLWTAVLAHGFIDTFGIALLCFSWAD
jgi:membrane protease YdiL (CAAX protease family)